MREGENEREPTRPSGADPKYDALSQSRSETEEWPSTGRRRRDLPPMSEPN